MRVELGGPAGQALADAVEDHQPGLLEAEQQLGGGRLGQPGQGAELGAGQRAPVEEDPKRRAVVDGPQQAGVPGSAGSLWRK